MTEDQLKQIKIDAAKKGWDMAMIYANNLCVQISVDFNDDEDMKEAAGATACYRKIQANAESYPTEWPKGEQENQSKEEPKEFVIDETWIDVDKQLPENDETVEILFDDRSKDISKFVQGHFYIIWDSQVRPITHWKSIKR